MLIWSTEKSATAFSLPRGVPPEPGKEATFEKLVDEIENAGHPQEQANGRVDYHEIGLIRSVVKGTPLIRRTGPTPGIPGIGVDGLPIASIPGKDTPLVAGAGTEISADDSNLLLAATGGEPVLLGNSAKVVGKLELDGVNFQTGNVDFDGSVAIRGPILTGFKVRAGGDIIAYEEVDGDELQAGLPSSKCSSSKHLPTTRRLLTVPLPDRIHATPRTMGHG